MLRCLVPFSFFTALILSGFTSCDIETAEAKKSQRLIIASDFLHVQDTLIFKEFVRENNVRVVIRHLSGNKIIEKIKREGFNSGLDIVLTKNMNTALRLNNVGALHDFEKNENDVQSQNPYISYTHNFVGIGLDPFVFKYPVDSVRTARHYQDLMKTKHYYTLSDADILSFLSPIRKERNRANTYEWIKNWKKNGSLRPAKAPWSDSAKVILCKYSQLDAFQDSIWSNYSKTIHFPNTDRAGVYFDLVCVSIVQQAEHFTEAQKFLAFCQNAGHNTVINSRIKRFPVYPCLSALKNGPPFYPVKIDQLVQYHEVLRRVLLKMK